MPADPQAFFDSAASYSETLSTWALAILGGSVLALLQRSYLRPESKSVRAAYVLFGVGWYFLARSIYFGTKAQEVQLSFLAQSNPDFHELRDAIGEDLIGQVSNLSYGLLAFGSWLAIYVTWWMVTTQSTANPNQLGGLS